MSSSNSYNCRVDSKIDFMDPNRKLIPKEQLFVKEYAKDYNATQAAIRAGYSAKGAGPTAHKLMQRPAVRKAIDGDLDKRCEKLEITNERILQELAKMGFANMQDYIVINKKTGSASLDFSKLTPNQAAAIQELTTEEFVERTTGKPRTVRRTRFKLADKRGALELLGKHKKLFTDKVENTLQNPDGTAIAPPVLNVNFVEAEDGQPKKKRTK